LQAVKLRGVAQQSMQLDRNAAGAAQVHKLHVCKASSQVASALSCCHQALSAAGVSAGMDATAAAAAASAAASSC
jgi:hypothetical protein